MTMLSLTHTTKNRDAARRGDLVVVRATALVS